MAAPPARRPARRRSPTPQSTSPTLEPLTGLLDRESFDEQLYTLIGARSRADDLYLVVLVLTLDGLSLLRGMHGEAGANRARIAAIPSWPMSPTPNS